MRTRPTNRRRRVDQIARRAAYDAYLTSGGWRARRHAWYAAWLTSHGTPPQCLVCDRVWCPRSGHLHHLTYIRIGREEMTTSYHCAPETTGSCTAFSSAARAGGT